MLSHFRVVLQFFFFQLNIGLERKTNLFVSVHKYLRFLVIAGLISLTCSWQHLCNCFLSDGHVVCSRTFTLAINTTTHSLLHSCPCPQIVDFFPILHTF